LSEVRGTVVAAETGSAVSGDGSDCAGRTDFSDALITWIRYVNIARAIHGNTLTIAQRGVRCRATIADVISPSHCIDPVDTRGRLE